MFFKILIVYLIIFYILYLAWLYISSFISIWFHSFNINLNRALHNITIEWETRTSKFFYYLRKSFIKLNKKFIEEYKRQGYSSSEAYNKIKLDFQAYIIDMISWNMIFWIFIVCAYIGLKYLRTSFYKNLQFSEFLNKIYILIIIAVIIASIIIYYGFPSTFYVCNEIYYIIRHMAALWEKP